MTLRVRVNGEEREVPDGTTVGALVDLLAPEHGRRGVAVALDEEVVPRGTWDERPLAEGARVEVVTAVGGGA